MNLIAFTVCSNNYFAQARVLAKGWLEHHPDTRLVIILVDELSRKIDYKIDERVDVRPVKTLKIDNLNELVDQYNITELNTSVKADSFIWIFQHYKAEKVVYLDPDIQIFSPFVEVNELLDRHNIIVTPHYCTPIDDGYSTTDIKMLGSGLYNLGFIGLSNYSQVENFLHWWRDRLHKYAYCDLENNMFYDQSWVSYITVFFDNYYILKHPGYNMANWNFHERIISKNKSGAYMVNETFPLRFFHYSGYKLLQPDVFAFYHTRYSFATRPDLVPLYSGYKKQLLENGEDQLRNMSCVYEDQHYQREEENAPLKQRLTRKAARLAKILFYIQK